VGGIWLVGWNLTMVVRSLNGTFFVLDVAAKVRVGFRIPPVVAHHLLRHVSGTWLLRCERNVCRYLAGSSKPVTRFDHRFIAELFCVLDLRER